MDDRPDHYDLEVDDDRPAKGEPLFNMRVDYTTDYWDPAAWGQTGDQK